MALPESGGLQPLQPPWLVRLRRPLMVLQGSCNLGYYRPGILDELASVYPMAAICHKSWWSRPPLSVLQSSFLPFPLMDSPGGLGRARSPAAKHFDAVYTSVQQPYKIHIDV